MSERDPELEMLLAATQMFAPSMTEAEFQSVKREIFRRLGVELPEAEEVEVNQTSSLLLVEDV